MTQAIASGQGRRRRPPGRTDPGKGTPPKREARRFKSHDQTEHQHPPCQPTPGQPPQRLTGASALVVDRVEADRSSTDAPTPTRRAVAGYDFTFSPPKSASVRWAVADANTQATIAAAHLKAIGGVLAFMERELAATLALRGLPHLRLARRIGCAPESAGNRPCRA
ncbi:relaxase domain-containing protein [Agrococcus sp. KRD186]|uniref:relaxase domain-containing protein n=1 Tax=Agrococcus sp. KRD186 TaxID=2729730 RepID=UPI00406D00EB